MSKFSYTDEEREFNKVIKMNKDLSSSLLNDNNLAESRRNADKSINQSIELLTSLGKKPEIKLSPRSKHEHNPQLEAWNELVNEADLLNPGIINLEDIFTVDEIEESFRELEGINQEFCRKTNIFNKTDLSFLSIATALQVTKSLLFPYVSQYFHYGESFDKNKRLDHNDPIIEQKHKEANDIFKGRFQKHENGKWINLLYLTPPYDITKGSTDLNINMGGRYHRMYTLGHDEILGWIFGTINILTDIITFNDFRSFRVTRNPMRITKQIVPMGQMFEESYEWIKDDYLNLPAAIFAQAQHLESDKYTKVGLPIPLLSSLNEKFANELYKKQYDSLCFSRDLKIIGSSFIVSTIIDIIITLVHSLYCDENEDKKLYEVRTRKILLVSNSIASTSSIINAYISENPKNLDIGSLLNTITHLFSDISFITKLKQEYIQNEIANRMQSEILEIDRLYNSI